MKVRSGGGFALDFDRLAAVLDERERVNELYKIFDEDSRFTRSEAARGEFVTTVLYIEKYVHGDCRILDAGAGSGIYSLYFAGKGFPVSAGNF